MTRSPEPFATTGPQIDATLETTSATASRYYQLVFIWMNDPATFDRYLRLAGTIVQRYGGALERMLVPDTIFAEGMRKPDIVNVVYYDDKEAYLALDNDPEFQSIVPLRTQSIDMATIEGVPTGGTLPRMPSVQSTYLIEIARCGPSGTGGYAHYTEQAVPVMRRYGYHVERSLAPDTASGFPFQPDVVNVAYFDSPDGMERFHQDPAHDRLERDLYPSAVQQSLWLVGHVHPMTLAARPR